MPTGRIVVVPIVLSLIFLVGCSVTDQAVFSNNLSIKGDLIGQTVPGQSDTICGYQVDPWLMGYPHLKATLGCALSPASKAPVAINEFGVGPDYDRFMVWYSQNGMIDVLFPDGSWQSYVDTWSEDKPTYACNPLGGTPTSPPLPRRGFGKLWCDDDSVQSSMGLIEVEERLCEEAIVQDFEDGKLFACVDDAIARYFRLSDDNTWDVETILPDQVYSITSIASHSPGAIRFAVIGDYGSGNADARNVATLVKSWKPDFIVTAGDNNYPSGSDSTIDKHIGQFYAEFIHPYQGAYGPQTPVSDRANRFFPALGNHDWESIECNAGGRCFGPYFDYFTLPGNERYYDIVAGPLHLFILDSDVAEPDGNGSDSAQALWLRDRLAASTASWKIAVLHHAPYSSFRHGSAEQLQWPFQEWGIDVVIAGHDHAYERLHIDGVIYLVNGLGGGRRYQLNTPIPGSRVRYNIEHGALLAEADENELTLSFISVSKDLIDSVTLIQ